MCPSVPAARTPDRVSLAETWTTPYFASLVSAENPRSHAEAAMRDPPAVGKALSLPCLRRVLLRRFPGFRGFRGFRGAIGLPLVGETIHPDDRIIAGPDGVEAVGREGAAIRLHVQPVHPLNCLAGLDVPEPKIMPLIVCREKPAAIGR